MPSSQVDIPFRKGYCLSVQCLSPTRGSLNILSGNDIAIHVSIRDNEKALVLNSWVNGAWGPEERPVGFPFDINQEIFVSVKAGADGFYISAGVVGTQTPFTYKYAYRLPETKVLERIYLDYENLKALAILPSDSALIGQSTQSELENSNESYRLPDRQGTEFSKGATVFDLFAGWYICAVKWGGLSGTWREGTEHLVVSQDKEVYLHSRFGTAAIKNLTVEGNKFSWSFDDNQTAASFTFKVDSEDSYFWYEGKQTGKLFEGWLQYPQEGPIDFRGKFASNKPKTPYPQSRTNAIESGAETVYLEFTDIDSYKFYEVNVDGAELIICYGRIGTPGQTSRTTYATPEKARTAARKKINEKLKKGYVEARMGDRLPRPPRSLDIAQFMRLAWKPIVTEGDSSLLSSKFSGKPWLAKDEPWPSCPFCGQFMQLFFQLNLDELPEPVRQEFGTGLLQTFYCANCEGGGEHPVVSYGDGGYIEPNVLIRTVQPNGAASTAPIPSALEDSFPAKTIVDWQQLEDYPDDPDEIVALIYGWDRVNDEALEYELLERLGFSTYEDYEEHCLTYDKDKLAGYPCWVQGIEYPGCPICCEPMRQVFQLGSDDNLPYEFGDGGIAHVLQCKTHKEQLVLNWACC